ncbi:MAG: YbjN domain-containing protein [Chlorobium sp.]|jgi:hypothetical protein|uniref:YbjN domain-containing protein n=1 Tax=Chlorobium sp. TaxID=1095 RepID=UPI0025BD34A4|nr:YbjN domain-containing protein [Chlorobium sp.]MCF8216656.1 YbjN domain-containing protein [Chlorobium sp.]MCF8271526.1 YbjN domain-containing protein [Chlorobium sp.]MCF8287898.1 YbjN domain-containing protein [Chlorobium sp.]MCF8291472.1 YbjN domain-containing protein [Chlorobium sp.]MCF8385567.1 YbjN domain-containing protein [Chlorobium sp.]
MRLAEIIEQFVEDIGWKDTVDRQADFCSLAVRLSIGGRSYRLMLEGFETQQWLALYLYAPFTVMASKFVDACMLFNFLNNNCSYAGTISMADDGLVCYRQIIDLEGAPADSVLIRNMLNAAVDLFERNAEFIEDVAQGEDRYEDARKEIEKSIR